MTQTNPEEVKPVEQTVLHEVTKFWWLARAIRWGVMDENRVINELSPEEMLARIETYLQRFIWREKILSRIMELKAYAEGLAQQEDEHHELHQKTGS